MKILKKLGTIVCLTLIFGVHAFADCSVDPGILSTPPCAAAQPAPDDPMPSNPPTIQTQSPSVFEITVTDAAIEVITNLLTVF